MKLHVRTTARTRTGAVRLLLVWAAALDRSITMPSDADPKLDGRSLRRGRACELFEKDGVSEDNIAYGLRLLMDRSFVIGHYDKISGEFDIERLSMDGHDFLDSIRDPDACGTWRVHYGFAYEAQAIKGKLAKWQATR